MQATCSVPKNPRIVSAARGAFSAGRVDMADPLKEIGCGWAFLFAAVIVSLAVLPGCAIDNVPTRHIVMADANGHPLDPTGNIGCEPEPQLCQGRHLPLWLFDYRTLATPSQPGATGKAYDAYLNEMLNAMREFHEKAGKDDANKAGASVSFTGHKKQKKKVLIFIHGGLNEQKHAVERATKLTELIMQEKGNEYYPIFINWDSSFFSSYYDHVFHLRQGEYVNYGDWYGFGWLKPRGLLLAPFYLTADLVRGLVQAPMVWAAELGKLEIEEGLQDDLGLDISLPFGSTIENDYKRVSCELMRDAGVTLKDYCKRYPPAPGYVRPPAGRIINIGEGDDHRELFPEKFFSGLSWTGTLPLKIIAAPLVESLGESAWNTMLRRTHMLFQTEEEFAGQAAGPYRPAAGVMAILLRRLAEEIAVSGGKDDWEITLVGHSMGTIIANEMLRDFSDLPFTNILYVGAASTIRDYEDSAFPYLEKNSNAQVYHLTLLEAAEERERQDLPIPFTGLRIPYVDPAMRGSLLIWLDDFLASPMTNLDRTVGGYANLMLAVHDTPEGIRSRVHIKAFSAGAGVPAPQIHEELANKLYFWHEHCWKATDQIQPDCFNAKGHVK
jgi:pimeloyl-ACP methyl ester carboxylesterase